MWKDGIAGETLKGGDLRDMEEVVDVVDVDDVVVAGEVVDRLSM